MDFQLGSLISLVALGVGAFISTDIDDLLLLVALFLGRWAHPREIAVGQFLGIGVLVVVSLLLSLTAMVISPKIIGLLGFVPLSLGALRLYTMWRGGKEDRDEEAAAQSSRVFGNAVAVSGITIANGGDNIGTYVPLFAMHPGTGSLVLIATFAVMTGVWLLAAFWLSTHPWISQKLGDAFRWLVPIVLMLIGVLILVNAHSAELIRTI